jgi:hypothetical protein
MKKIFILIVLIFFTVFLNNATAAPTNSTEETSDTGNRVTLDNPLGETNPNILIGRVINAILGLVGSLALVMFIYGGFTWMTAAGSSEKVTKGKDIIIWATIGLMTLSQFSLKSEELALPLSYAAH